MTWMRGRNSLDELMAEAEREQDRQEASLGGNEPTTAAAQGQQGQGQAQQVGGQEGWLDCLFVCFCPHA